VRLFKENLIDGSTLLLGSTKDLLSLCDEALDTFPVYNDKKIITGHWADNNIFYQNIMGDGVLNLNEVLCNQIMAMAKKNCCRLIVRVFNYRLPIMKVATYFPTANHFKKKPEVIYHTEEYSFFKWDFENNEST
jgi:hypothetical protein